MEDFEHELKVLVVGNGGVGKTSMIKRFCKNLYTDEYKKTIGVDFLEKCVYVDALGEEVRFMLWDTAGQEEFDSITRVYYRGGGAAVIAFSTNDRASFDALPSWKEKVEAECGEIAVAIVQNKVDLLHEAAMTAEEVEGMARQLGCKLYRTCVKEDINVGEVFIYLAELHNKKVNTGRLGRPVQKKPSAAASPQSSLPAPAPEPEPEQQPAEASGQQSSLPQQQPPQQPQQQPQPPTPRQEPPPAGPPQALTVDPSKPNKQRGKKKKPMCF